MRLRRGKARGLDSAVMWVSQLGSSTEQPNPQIPDITSSSRPGPTASPSPSSLPPLWGQGRDSGLVQFRKDHHTHQGPAPGQGSAGSPTHMLRLLTMEPRDQGAPNRQHLGGHRYR